MSLLDGAIGAEVSYDLSIVDQKLRFMIKYDGKGADASFIIDLEAGYFADKLKAAIPGGIDDVIIDMLKAALLK